MAKDRMITFRMNVDTIERYKKFCEENSYTFSKRVRRLIELELERWEKYKLDKMKEEIVKKTFGDR